MFSKRIKLRYSSGTLTFNFIYLYKIISDKDPYRVTIEEASLIKEIYTVHNLQKYFPIALYIVFGGVKALWFSLIRDILLFLYHSNRWCYIIFLNQASYAFGYYNIFRHPVKTWFQKVLHKPECWFATLSV